MPPIGTPIFGPHGPVGTVVNKAGNVGVVAPVGGGSPGILVPNPNGTATVYQPGKAPVVIPNPAR